jgi:prolyl-tRNA synthetase
MIMIHSDNTGIVIPPRVAQNQVVIVPITSSKDDPKVIIDQAFELKKEL